MLLDGFYTVLEKSSSEVEVLLSTEEHPVFQAHFPQNLIMPGFVHLDIIEDIFALEILSIKKAKYKAVVLPSATLTYKKEGNSVKIYSQEQEIANFFISCK